MQIEKLQEAIAPQRAALLQHPVYQELQEMEDLRLFMQHHVYAVWDFMSLVKALQRELTCVDTPWLPSPEPELRRLINDIVLGEESDEAPDGSYLSHYELYLLAMQDAGADTQAIETLLEAIRAGKEVRTAIAEASLPKTVSDFLDYTFSLIEEGAPHRIAAAFTFGREDLIPDMFRAIVKDLHKDEPQKLDTFVYYLDRHIELDEDEHGPMALKMIQALCGEDADKWAEATAAAQQALELRKALWDGIYSEVRARQEALQGV